MSGVCEMCMKREARSAHDLYCDSCEATIVRRSDAEEIVRLRAQVIRLNNRVELYRLERDQARDEVHRLHVLMNIPAPAIDP